MKRLLSTHFGFRHFCKNLFHFSALTALISFSPFFPFSLFSSLSAIGYSWVNNNISKPTASFSGVELRRSTLFRLHLVLICTWRSPHYLANRWGLVATTGSQLFNQGATPQFGYGIPSQNMLGQPGECIGRSTVTVLFLTTSELSMQELRG